MANDINMWRDIITMEELGRDEEAKDLQRCFHARNIEGKEDKAELLKQEFEYKYGYWGNWY